MYILGLNIYHGDSSAAIIKDGKLLAAVEEERFIRQKHWAGFPKEAIRYCLKQAGIGIEAIDHITLNRNPRVNLHKKLFTIIKIRPDYKHIINRIKNMSNIKNVRQFIAEEFQVSSDKLKAKIHNIEHHRSHLASSFFVSDFNKAALVSVDGFGDFTSLMVAKGEENNINVLYEINYPHSLGVFYSAFTQFLGFNRYGDEYKMMGLSASGRPRYLDEMRKVVILQPKGRFKLNLDYFRHHKYGDEMRWDGVVPSFSKFYSDKLRDLFGYERSEKEELNEHHMDIAASAQAMYEEAFLHVLRYAYNITSSNKLCLSGGCALNSLANGKIDDKTGFKETYIPPGAHDAGGAIGSAYYLYNQILDNDRVFSMSTSYWGPGFSRDEISVAIDSRRSKISDCVIKYFDNKSDLCKKTAAYISDGKIVGWFQGRMEWGARALGNRSILADPRREDMRDMLNSKIKMREPFRPFAPSILLEYVSEYFEKDMPVPFMQKVFYVNKNKQAIIPAVTHLDGSGRLQTVKKEDSPLYWQLIEEFRKISGVPVLLNTSFNENEPIVCKPEEALDCFIRTYIDILVLGNYMITRRQVE